MRSITKAAKNNGLRLGLSVHAAHAWNWYETAQRSDKNGPKAGIPYDGKLTKEDGKGKWWLFYSLWCCRRGGRDYIWLLW